MQRRTAEQSIARREWLRHRSLHVRANLVKVEVGTDPFVVDCPCDRQIGRFRKRKGRGCGRVRCLLCRPEKYPQRVPTRRERLSQQDLREQVARL